MIDLGVSQRQSPLAMVLLGIRLLRNMGFGQIAVFVLVVSRNPFGGALFVVPVLAAAILAALSTLAWWRFTFQLADGELVVTKGVFRLERLTVPLDRIQSLAIEQELLHRLSGLVKLTVDTAGSDEAEFTIDAIGRQVAEQLQREAVTARPDRHAIEVEPNSPPGASGPPGAPLVDQEQIVFRHDARRLLRSALSMWPLTGFFILGPFLAFGDRIFDGLGASTPDVDATDPRWWWLPAGLVAFAVLSVALNVVRVMLQDWQLTVRSTATTVRRTSGLLSRTNTASAVARVQVIASDQNPLQRRAGVRDVTLATIGDGNISSIGCDDDQFDALRRVAGATTDGRQPERRVHPAEIWLAVRNTSVAVIAVAIGGYLAVGLWSLAVLVAIPLVWLSRRRRIRLYRWSLGAELMTREQVVDISTRQAQLHKTNAVTVSQSMFERRRNLGRVSVATAAGTITIGMIGIDEAKAVRDVALQVAETDSRSWM